MKIPNFWLCLVSQCTLSNWRSYFRKRYSTLEYRACLGLHAQIPHLQKGKKKVILTMWMYASMVFLPFWMNQILKSYLKGFWWPFSHLSPAIAAGLVAIRRQVPSLLFAPPLGSWALSSVSLPRSPIHVEAVTNSSGKQTETPTCSEALPRAAIVQRQCVRECAWYLHLTFWVERKACINGAY